MVAYVFLGVFAATLVHALFTPSGVERAFWADAERWRWDPAWSPEDDEEVIELTDILDENPNPAPPTPKETSDASTC